MFATRRPPLSRVTHSLVRVFPVSTSLYSRTLSTLFE